MPCVLTLRKISWDWFQILTPVQKTDNVLGYSIGQLYPTPIANIGTSAECDPMMGEITTPEKPQAPAPANPNPAPANPSPAPANPNPAPPPNPNPQSVRFSALATNDSNMNKKDGTDILFAHFKLASTALEITYVLCMQFEECVCIIFRLLSSISLPIMLLRHFSVSKKSVTSTLGTLGGFLSLAYTCCLYFAITTRVFFDKVKHYRRRKQEQDRKESIHAVELMDVDGPKTTIRVNNTNFQIPCSVLPYNPKDHPDVHTTVDENDTPQSSFVFLYMLVDVVHFFRFCAFLNESCLFQTQINFCEGWMSCELGSRHWKLRGRLLPQRRLSRPVLHRSWGRQQDPQAGLCPQAWS